MAKTIGSFDLASLKNLRDDVTQYFWFESDSSSAWGSGAHVTLYPESQFTDSTSPNYMKGQNIIMNTDGFSIRNGGLPMMVLDNDSLDFNAVDTSLGTYTTMATFGLTGATIGQSGASRLEIDSQSMRMVDRNGNSYLYISDLRDSDGKAHIIDTFTSDGIELAYYLTYPAISSDYTVIVSDGSGGSVQKTADMFVFANIPTIGATITAEYDTESEEVKAYTVGIRGTGDVGASSTIIGTKCVASNKFAYADGYKTEAEGVAAHAEGFRTTASGDDSHAEGFFTTASGDDSHAEGYRTRAEGNYSHVQNLRTIAGYDYQTVIGKNNDNQPDTAFEIGNGELNARSNALTVDWSGNVNASGSVITSAKYNDAYYADSSAGYSVTISSLAGSTYLGQEIRLATVASTSKLPIFNGFDIRGTGTARIHTLAHYIYKSTYNGQAYWTAYIKMRNDNTTAISNFTVTAYIAWV